jgi:hypothetical protein
MSEMHKGDKLMANIQFKDGEHEVEEVKIVSVNYNPDTLEQNTYVDGKFQRTETVNLDENILFNHCETIWDIEDKYEAFWNRLNKLESGWKPQAIVKVLKVSRTEETE